MDTVMYFKFSIFRRQLWYTLPQPKASENKSNVNKKIIVYYPGSLLSLTITTPYFNHCPPPLSLSLERECRVERGTVPYSFIHSPTVL